MFTGLIQDSAQVLRFERQSETLWRLELKTRLDSAKDWLMGASIACNGACLTLLTPGSQTLAFELSHETLNRTNFGALKEGEKVHIEPSLKVGDALGGHWVTGHVDAVGILKSITPKTGVSEVVFEVTGEARKLIAPYLVEKGCIAIDGVSLTVNTVRDTATTTEFDVVLIPHTLKETRFGSMKAGDKVNLEADLMAKYVLRGKKFL